MKTQIGFAFGLALLCAAPLHAQEIKSWEIAPFTRPEGVNPIITPNPDSTFMDPIKKELVHWEKLHTFNPGAIVRDGKVYLIYRTEDDSGKMQIGGHTSRMGLAESTDGLHFTRHPEPVFYPAEDSQKDREWFGGVEDPRIVESEDGTYYLTYTQWNGVDYYSAAIASSKDLVHWDKHGPVFLTAANGKYAKMEYKSCGIVTRFDKKKGRLIAVKIDGKYWMYWGDGPIRLATSDDLIHWTPVEDATGKPLVLLDTRPGHFDSVLAEMGPPPVLTKKGIVIIYNGMNKPGEGDPDLGPNAYGAGEALFDAHHPARLIDRLEKPVVWPEEPYEKTGQYVAGDTFTQGLVFFKNQWFLYYGCADKLVAVVTAPAR